MATMYYDDAADLALIRAKKVGSHWVWIAGTRARAEPSGQRGERASRACRRPAGRVTRRARRA